MKRVSLAIAVAAVAIAVLPAAASASAGVRGVVVSHSHGSLLVATHSGRVVQIKGSAKVGSRVVGGRVVGRATRPRLHGVVVATKGATLFVASNRHLLAIRTGGRHLAGSGSPSGDTPGTVITSTVNVKGNGELDQEGQSEDGQDNSSTIQIQATVAAVGTGTITLTVNGQNVTVDLPAGLTLPQSLVGQTVTIDVSLSHDDNQGDDDSQGDQGGSDSGSGGGD
jgi:hypothetical protein